MMECKDIQYWILWYSICSWEDYWCQNNGSETLALLRSLYIFTFHEIIAYFCVTFAPKFVGKITGVHLPPLIFPALGEQFGHSLLCFCIKCSWSLCLTAEETPEQSSFDEWDECPWDAAIGGIKKFEAANVTIGNCWGCGGCNEKLIRGCSNAKILKSLH